MSTKAPGVFGAPKTTAASTSSAPPMSTKAPGVFGAPKTSTVGSSLFETAKNAVIEIYEKHNPAKLSEVDSLLAKYAGKEGELVSRLRAKYLATPQLFVSTPEDAPGSRVYMDFMDTDGKQLGRVKYRLYDTNTPLTANNFRSLCTGELVC
jgi:phosphoribosyl-dephospho-CoA transferase